MKFTKNGNLYSVIRTDDTTSEGTPIFKFAVWNSKGQMVDADEVSANCIEEAKDRILNF